MFIFFIGYYIETSAALRIKNEKYVSNDNSDDIHKNDGDSNVEKNKNHRNNNKNKRTKNEKNNRDLDAIKRHLLVENLVLDLGLKKVKHSAVGDTKTRGRGCLLIFILSDVWSIIVVECIGIII